MEALYQSILDLLSKVVIPDWGQLIGLMPLGLAALAALWFAWTFRRFATAGPTRRAPARVTPVAPPGLHMPGGSAAPLVAALGAASLFGGMVIGGTALLVGATILALTLLYWGREAIRDYDRAAHARMPRRCRPSSIPAPRPASTCPGPRSGPSSERWARPRSWPGSSSAAGSSRPA